MNQLDLIRKFHSILPMVREWIESTLQKHSANTTPVSNLSFSRIESVLPVELLDKAKVVVVKGALPFPPLSRMGLPELSQMEDMEMAGITYKDTFFVRHPYQTESLHFHELVHVVQWEELGADNFLLAYGAGFIQFGYHDSPLEKMAYSFQDMFVSGTLPADTVELIRQQTNAIWNTVSSFTLPFTSPFTNT
jgi:hypothetical protein